MSSERIEQNREEDIVVPPEYVEADDICGQVSRQSRNVHGEVVGRLKMPGIEVGSR